MLHSHFKRAPTAGQIGTHRRAMAASSELSFFEEHARFEEISQALCALEDVAENQDRASALVHEAGSIVSSD
jgi:hypothetical protein